MKTARLIYSFIIFLGSLTFIPPKSRSNGLEPISPIEKQTYDPDEIVLGGILFMDKRLSKDNSVSCFSCHNIFSNGADNKRFSVGVQKTELPLNTPTVFNSSLNSFQFWNGRAKSLEDQIDGPLITKNEMGSNWKDVVEKLQNDPKIASQFKKVYNRPISEKLIKKAISNFERSLVTPDSQFDKYLKGDTSAISKSQADGYRLFKTYGCTSCHQGRSVGGNFFQKFGLIIPYYDKDSLAEGSVHLGRFNITKLESDRFVFKVPSLRNVANTAPYLHDGSIDSLNKVIKLMGRHQLGVDISEDDALKIEMFLNTLNAPIPESTSLLRRHLEK